MAQVSLSIGLLGASQLASPTAVPSWSSRHHTVREREPAAPHAGPQLSHVFETLAMGECAHRETKKVQSETERQMRVLLARRTVSAHPFRNAIVASLTRKSSAARRRSAW